MKKNKKDPTLSMLEKMSNIKRIRIIENYLLKVQVELNEVFAQKIFLLQDIVIRLQQKIGRKK